MIAVGAVAVTVTGVSAVEVMVSEPLMLVIA